MMDGNTPRPDPPGPKPPIPGTTIWWPFVLILVLLMLASCGWFFYARTKSAPHTAPVAAKEGDQVYESLQPQSNEGGDDEIEFESGLNPNEDGGME
jgi:flagellar biosynthesis/type III secretory pathway M-ring protein FliF/YscJ